MSSKFTYSNLRNWWNNLDNIWQKILILNLGLELELGGVISHMDKFKLNYGKLESLYEEGTFCSWYKTHNVISDDLIGQIVNLKVLLASYTGISDLSPLSMLLNLESINLSNNKIKDITPLKNLVNLQELHLSFNQITSVEPLKHLNRLRVLNVLMNNILSLEPIDNLENLESLYCKFNFTDDSSLIPKVSSKWKKLKSLSVDQIIGLHSLPEYYPHLESLQISGLKGDLSTIIKLKHLKSLYIIHNQISDLDVLTALTELKTLYLDWNYNLESIEPLSQLTKLEHVGFNYNKIISLKPLRKLKKLKVIHCSMNKIVNLEPLVDLTNLEHLDCSNNDSKSLGKNRIISLDPLKNLSHLKQLNCKNNPIRPREIAIFKATHPNCEVIF